jgi:hypothetical protein
MATFRSSAAIVLALLFLACSSQSAQEATAIDHLVPKRDFVGPLPARFEWTAAKGAEEYAMTIENEVDVLLFEARTRDTFLDWPKGSTLDPGTYFWRVVGVSGGRAVADSGRAAFVVVER